MLLAQNIIKILTMSKQASIRLFVIIMATMFLSSCGGEDSVTLDERMHRALTWQSDGNLKAAVIELKNALITYPESKDVRFLLGRVYLELGMGFAAEKEIKKAEELGLDENISLLPLVESWLLLRKYDSIIEKISSEPESVTTASVGQRYFLGAAYLGKGDINVAEGYFDEILTSTPGNMRALVGKARISFIKKDIENTNKYIALAEAILPNDKELLQLRASRSWIANDFEAVEVYYSKLVEYYPDFYINEIYLAWVRIINGKLDEAGKTLERFRKVAPENALVNYVSALYAVISKEYLEAKTYAEKVLLNSPDDIRTKFIAATATYALGDIEQSYSYIQQYLDAVPEDVHAKELLAQLQVRLNKQEEAYDTLKDISDLAEKKEKFLNLMASYELQKGDIELARLHLEQSLLENPEQIRSRQRLAFLKISEGEIEEGLKDMEKALEGVPDDFFRKMQLARTHIVAQKYTKAIEICRELQNMDSEDINGYLCEGTALYKKNDIQKALSLFEKVLKMNPGNLEASRMATAIHLKNSSLKKAQFVQEQFLKIHPSDAKSAFGMYMLKMSGGSSEEAIEYLKKSVELDPNERLYVLYLARHYFLSNEVAKVLEVSDKIMPLYPKAEGLIEVRGKAQMALKRFSSAGRSFEKLAKLKPKNITALSLLASAYDADKDYQKLETVVLEILALNPKDTKALIFQAKVEASRGKWQKADDILSEIKSNSGTDNEYNLLRGRVYAANKDYKKAAYFFEKSFQAKKNSINLLQLTTVYRLSGKFDAAISLMEDWHRNHPNDMLTAASLGDIYLEKENFERANEIYTLILEKNPKQSAVLNNLAWSLHMQDKMDEALITIRKAREINPNVATFLDTEAKILLAKGEVNGAVRQYRKAVDKAPDSLDFKYHLVLALMQAGETMEATDLLMDLKQDGRPFEGQDEAFDLLEKLTTE